MSQEIPVLLPKEFDAERLVFTEVPSKDDNSTSVRIRYQHDGSSEPERFIMQTAKMKIPFGLANDSRFAKDPSKLKWSLQLSFSDEDRSKRIQRFRTAMNDFDKKCKEVLLKHGDVWIPLPPDEDDDGNFVEARHDEKSIRKIYYSALKRFKFNPKKHKEGDRYPDTFKITVPWDNESIVNSDDEDDVGSPRKNIEFYDESGNEISWKEVTPGSDVVALFEINGLYCAKGLKTVSPSVRLVQLQVFKPKRLKGFKIKYDDDDNVGEESEDEEDDDLVDNNSLENAEEVVEEEVEVSDEEEEEE